MNVKQYQTKGQTMDNSCMTIIADDSLKVNEIIAKLPVLTKRIETVDTNKEYENFNPLMKNTEFESMVASMKEDGQKDPVWLHDGLIVDGRHRWLALNAIDSDTIECKELPYSWDEETIIQAIISSETRRQKSKTQTAIQAARYYLKRKGTPHKITDGATAIKFGVSRGYITDAKKVIKKASEADVESLFNGFRVNMMNGKIRTQTDSLRVFLKYLNGNSNTEPEDLKMKLSNDELSLVNRMRSDVQNSIFQDGLPSEDFANYAKKKLVSDLFEVIKLLEKQDMYSNIELPEMKESPTTKREDVVELQPEDIKARFMNAMATMRPRNKKSA